MQHRLRSRHLITIHYQVFSPPGSNFVQCFRDQGQQRGHSAVRNRKYRLPSASGCLRWDRQHLATSCTVHSRLLPLPLASSFERSVSSVLRSYRVFLLCLMTFFEPATKGEFMSLYMYCIDQVWPTSLTMEAPSTWDRRWLLYRDLLSPLHSTQFVILRCMDWKTPSLLLAPTDTMHHIYASVENGDDIEREAHPRCTEKALFRIYTWSTHRSVLTRHRRRLTVPSIDVLKANYSPCRADSDIIPTPLIDSVTARVPVPQYASAAERVGGL